MSKPAYSLKEITPKRVASARVETDFFAKMLRKLADQHTDSRGKADPHLAAFFAYVEYKGIEPGQSDDNPAMTLDAHLEISAAVNRFFAMGALEQAGHLKNWVREKDDHLMLHPALIEAACNSQLLVKGEEFSFQPLEFLNHALGAATPNEPFAGGR